jgi:hypothetical protein
MGGREENEKEYSKNFIGATYLIAYFFSRYII